VDALVILRRITLTDHSYSSLLPYRRGFRVEQFGDFFENSFWGYWSFARQSWKRAENKSRCGPLRQSRNSAQWSESLRNLLLTWILQRKTTAQTSFAHLRSGRRKRDENVQIQMRCKAGYWVLGIGFKKNRKLLYRSIQMYANVWKRLSNR
jgi:hypothetical protein